jgi:hypothetical protein
MTKPGKTSTPGSPQLDNYRIYRPEAVKAHTFRRAGEPWLRSRNWLEGGIILLLSVLAALGGYAMFVAGS